MSEGPSDAQSKRTVASVRDRLRKATHAAHVRLNHHPLLCDLTRACLVTRTYTTVLQAYARYYQDVEARIVSWLDHPASPIAYQSRHKIPWLKADLDYFGLPWPENSDDSLSLAGVPRCQPARDIDQSTQLGQLAGTLYAIEGSTLGGQVIAKHLHLNFGFGKDSGARFFHGYGEYTAERWHELCDFLESMAGEVGQIRAAETAAIGEFEQLEGVLNGYL